MHFFVKLVLATIVWLGIFESHLIQPIAVLPLSYVLEALTLPDFFLWFGCFLAVEFLDLVTSYCFQRTGPTELPYRPDRVPVAKRGSRGHLR